MPQRIDPNRLSRCGKAVHLIGTQISKENEWKRSDLEKALGMTGGYARYVYGDRPIHESHLLRLFEAFETTFKTSLPYTDVLTVRTACRCQDLRDPRAPESKAAVQWAKAEAKRMIGLEPRNPAYLVDAASRVLYINPLVPKLLRADWLPSMHRVLYGITTLLKITMADLMFNPRYQVSEWIENRTDFMPVNVQFYHHITEAVHGQEWFEALNVRWEKKYPRFRYLWAKAKMEPHTALPTTPFTFQYNPGRGKDNEMLRFTVAPQLLKDKRFFLVFLAPKDSTTIKRCEIWAAESE